MKTFKLSLLICLILTLTLSAFSQRKFGGKVVEVLDGKTAVVQMYNGGKLTVVLQYIEIPEADQPLYQSVKEHLQGLILDKDIEINPRGVSNSKTVGQVTVKGVDISQQMIRDGAAWHATLESGGQNTGENANYQKQEAQAKAEKRGVWSIEGMKPAWEFRAAKEEAAKQAERDALEKIKREAEAARAQNEAAAVAKPSVRRRPVDSGEILWAKPDIEDLFEFPDANGLLKLTLRGTTNEIPMTASSFYSISNGKEKRQLESRTFYLGNILGRELAMASIGFLSKSDRKLFQNSNNLIVFADGQKFNLGKPFRLERSKGGRFEEVLFYYFNMKTLIAIAQAQNVKINLGTYSAPMPVQAHESLKNLTLEVAKK